MEQSPQEQELCEGLLQALRAQGCNSLRASFLHQQADTFSILILKLHLTNKAATDCSLRLAAVSFSSHQSSIFVLVWFLIASPCLAGTVQSQGLVQLLLQETLSTFASGRGFLCQLEVGLQGEGDF